MKVALAAVLALAACSDATTDPRAPRSGDRIKLVHYEYEGGAVDRERGFFYDSVLGALCYEETWSDGARYCTPTVAEAVYKNNHCSQPIGIVTGETAPKFFATFYTLHDDPLISTVYRVGQPTTAPSLVWRMTDLGCAGPFVYDIPDAHYYDVGEVVPLKDSRILHSIPQGAERLVNLYVTSPDGLQIAVDVYDQKQDFACRADGAANATSAACHPATTDGLVSYFTDPTCSAPILPVDTASPPTLARREDPVTGCTSYFRVTRERLPEALYRLVGDHCVPDTNEVAPRYYDVEPLELASVERRRAGSGRVQTIELGDLAITDRLLYDAELGVDCERVTLDSGELRCLPTSSAMLRSLYADEACQTAIDIAIVPARQCDRPETYVRAAQVHAIGDLYTGPLYEQTTGDRCGELPMPAGYQAHAVGPALPMDMFPVATMSFEP